MLRCFFVVTILRLWEEGKIPSIPKIKVTVNYTNRNILPFFIDLKSFFTTLSKINVNYAGMIREKEKNGKTNCITCIATGSRKFQPIIELVSAVENGLKQCI